ARTSAVWTSRERGGAFITKASRSSRAALATAARSKACRFAREGRVKSLSLRTNCSADPLISSSVTGGLKLCNVLVLRHIAITSVPTGTLQAVGRGGLGGRFRHT